MGNIKNYNFNKLDLYLSNNGFWDFYLAGDDASGGSSVITTGDCLVSLFDFNDSGIYNVSSSTISSLVYWTGATNTGYTFSTIGLTGIDNGLVPYVKDYSDPLNLNLLSALTGNTLIIPANDKRLHLNPISGSTEQYIYPINTELDLSGDYAQFCGGFYQGYYKIDGSTYQVLPIREHKGWVAEFWLKRDENSCSGYTGTTLNDDFPENKGFFFYMGTRAENKFWNRFEGVDTGCTSACTVDIGCTGTPSTYCTIPRETDIFISGANGTQISLYPNQVNTTEITNGFLLYGRASGATTCSVCGGYASGLANQMVSCGNSAHSVTITTPKTIVSNTTNPFLIYGRAGSGTTRCGGCGGVISGYGDELACSFSGTERSIQYDNLNYSADVMDNAIGFRIKDDGSIGYRTLVITGACSGQTYISGYTVQEGYSASGTVSANVWTNVVIRYTTDYYDDCDLQIKGPRKGKLMFYVNGKLKHVVNDFNEFIARSLNDYAEKQVGVPYNISLGGGSQGLLETQTFDGRDPDDLGLLIESNFAGSFLGGISQFKFYICDLYFTDIQNIYNQEKNRYTQANSSILTENGNNLTQENGYNLLLG